MKMLQHRQITLAIALLGTLAAQSALACKAPATPRLLPSGRSADAATMLEARRAIEQYVDQVFVYTSCENDSLKLQQVMARQKLVMDRFNAEVRAFNTQARAISVIHRN